MTNISNQISEHNARVYMDIAKDMLDQKDGVFTFVVRVDGKHIVDYVQLQSIVYSELTITEWKIK